MIVVALEHAWNRVQVILTEGRGAPTQLDRHFVQTTRSAAVPYVPKTRNDRADRPETHIRSRVINCVGSQPYVLQVFHNLLPVGRMRFAPEWRRRALVPSRKSAQLDRRRGESAVRGRDPARTIYLLSGNTMPAESRSALKPLTESKTCRMSNCTRILTFGLDVRKSTPAPPCSAKSLRSQTPQ
jgi:hypothetical protein